MQARHATAGTSFCAAARHVCLTARVSAGRRDNHHAQRGVSRGVERAHLLPRLPRRARASAATTGLLQLLTQRRTPARACCFLRAHAPSLGAEGVQLDRWAKGKGVHVSSSSLHIMRWGASFGKWHGTAFEPRPSSKRIGKRVVPPLGRQARRHFYEHQPPTPRAVHLPKLARCPFRLPVALSASEIAVSGDGWSSRVLDAVVHGCIPVIIEVGARKRARGGGPRAAQTRHSSGR
eukprot:4338176-Pleurochrysis_carterae.AAC.1